MNALSVTEVEDYISSLQFCYSIHLNGYKVTDEDQSVLGSQVIYTMQLTEH